MRFIKVLVLLGGLAAISTAAPITVNLDATLLEGGISTSLPVYLGGNFAGDPNRMRFRFSVPDFASITAIHSINVSVDIFDDGDGQTNEVGAIQFVGEVGPPNLFVASFGPGFNSATSVAPLHVGAQVDPADLTTALAAIQDDGIFFIRVDRNGGDFFVGAGSVTIDADLVPEPATLSTCMAGLAALTLARIFRRRHP